MNENIKAYACYNTNEEQRRKSSSGGLFSVLAEYWLDFGEKVDKVRADGDLCCLEKPNVVYGVAMTKDCYGAEYIRVTDKMGLGKLRGSKYLQTIVGDIFRNVKSDLEEGRKVLFSGTGCVINGLKNFLQKEYDNLFCIDVICHGVPSPALWEKYAKHQERKYGKLLDINFRCKDHSWKDFGMKENQVFISKDRDSFMQMFLRDYCLRPSCYECKAKSIRKSDLTIADFWGIEHIAPEMNDGKGTSLVVIRTPKGGEIFSKLKHCLQLKEVTYAGAVKYNPAEYKSAKRPEQRDYFFIDMWNMQYDELEKKYASPLPLPMIKRVKRKVKTVLKLLLNYIGGGYRKEC